MNRYRELIVDTFHFLLARAFRKHGVPYQKTIDPERVQEIEKHLYLLLFVVFSLSMPFIFGLSIFLYWSLLSVVAFLVLRYDFFEDRLVKKVKFEQKAKNRLLTFLEKTQLTKVTEQISKVQGHKILKQIKKKETEVYELKSEGKSVKKLQTQYYKEFSPHSNRLQSLRNPTNKSNLQKDEYQIEDQRDYSSKEIKYFTRFDTFNQENLPKISEVHESKEDIPLPSPKIKVREIKNDYDIALKRQKEIAALYEFSFKENQKAESLKEEPLIKQASSNKPLILDSSPPRPEEQPSSPVKQTPSEPKGLFSKPADENQLKPGLGLGLSNLTNQQKPVQPSGLFPSQPTATSQPSQPLFAAKPTEQKPVTSSLLNPGQKEENKPSVGGLFSSSVFGGGNAGTNAKPVAPAQPTGPFSGGAAQPTTIVQAQPPAQTVINPPAGIPSLSSSGPSNVGEASDKTYTEYFASKVKIVDQISDLLQSEVNNAGIEKFERLPGLRGVVDEVRPMLNAKFTNQIGSVLRSADIIITKFAENRNNRVVYYGLIQYIGDNVLKNIESYYEKGQKLSLYFRLALVLLINKRIPGMTEYIILRMAKDVPVLGGVEPKRQPGMSQADFWKLQGYKVSGNERESYKEYDKRLNAYTYFFFMTTTLTLEDVLNDAPDEEKGPNIIQVATASFRSKTSYDWMYWSFIKFFLKVPIQLSTVHVLVGYYYSSAYTQRRQPNQVARLMKLLYAKYIPELEKFGATIKDIDEKNDFIENKLRFLKSKLKKFPDNDREGMNILTPVEEAKREEIRVEDDRE